MEKLRYILFFLVLLCFCDKKTNNFENYKKGVSNFFDNNILENFEDYYTIYGNFNKNKFINYLIAKNINSQSDVFFFGFTNDTLSKIGTNDMYFVSYPKKMKKNSEVVEFRDLNSHNYNKVYCLLEIESPRKRFGVFKITKERLLIRQQDSKYINLLRQGPNDFTALHAKISKDKIEMFYPKDTTQLTDKQLKVLTLLKNNYLSTLTEGSQLVIRTTQ